MGRASLCYRPVETEKARQAASELGVKEQEFVRGRRRVEEGRAGRRWVGAGAAFSASARQGSFEGSGRAGRGREEPPPSSRHGPAEQQKNDSAMIGVQHPGGEQQSSAPEADEAYSNDIYPPTDEQKDVNLTHVERGYTNLAKEEFEQHRQAVKRRVHKFIAEVNPKVIILSKKNRVLDFDDEAFPLWDFDDEVKPHAAGGTWRKTLEGSKPPPPEGSRVHSRVSGAGMSPRAEVFRRQIPICLSLDALSKQGKTMDHSGMLSVVEESIGVRRPWLILYEDGDGKLGRRRGAGGRRF